MKLDNDDTLHLYEKMYFWEIDRRDKISQRTPTVIVVALAIIGLQSYVFKMLLSVHSGDTSVVPAVLLALSFVAMVIGVVYLVISWHCGAYAYLPSCKTLADRRLELLCHLCAEGVEDAEREVWQARYFATDMIEYYIECSSTNFDRNNSKSTRLYVAFNWLMVSLIPGSIAFVVLVIANGVCP